MSLAPLVGVLSKGRAMSRRRSRPARDPAARPSCLAGVSLSEVTCVGVSCLCDSSAEGSGERRALPRSPELWDGTGVTWFPALWDQRGFNRSLRVSYPPVGKFTRVFQRNALFQAKLLTKIQKDEEEEGRRAWGIVT